MILFEDVTKHYSTGTIALDNATFQIDDNDFVFLVGPSGAGKTTILKMVLRETKPTSGTIIVNDITITDPSFKKVQELRRQIGVVFQDFKILHDKNVFENIGIALKVTGVPDNEMRHQVNEVLELVGLPDKKFMFPVQLSAGELQRVAIARAVVGNRTIILADEPTGNLDPKTTWDVMKIFKKFEKNKTIIFATHNTDIVNSMKRRVIVVRNGALVKDQRKGGYEL